MWEHAQIKTQDCLNPLLKTAITEDFSTCVGLGTPYYNVILELPDIVMEPEEDGGLALQC
jgi:hypothetical protein